MVRCSRSCDMLAPHQTRAAAKLLIKGQASTSHLLLFPQRAMIETSKKCIDNEEALESLMMNKPRSKKGLKRTAAVRLSQLLWPFNPLQLRLSTTEVQFYSWHVKAQTPQRGAALSAWIAGGWGRVMGVALAFQTQPSLATISDEPLP